MEQLLTRKEACDRLGISSNKMGELTATGEIAYIQHRPGGKMFFLPEDLEAFMRRCRQPTREERAALTVLPGKSTLRRRRGA